MNTKPENFSHWVRVTDTILVALLWSAFKSFPTIRTKQITNTTLESPAKHLFGCLPLLQAILTPSQRPLPPPCGENKKTQRDFYRTTLSIESISNLPISVRLCP